MVHLLLQTSLDAFLLDHYPAAKTVNPAPGVRLTQTPPQLNKSADPAWMRWP
jgi:hypothetical protein